MLKLTIPATELYNDSTNEFVYTKEQTIQIEHSLLSISKWESKYHKPFLSDDKKTEEELRDYIRFMTITQNVPYDAYYALSTDNFTAILEYMEDPMTATEFYDTDNTKTKHKKEIITSEIVYYWMIQMNIPMQFEKWHFNRLMALIKVIGIKNGPKKKMNRNDYYAYQRMQNQKRRSKYNSKG